MENIISEGCNAKLVFWGKAADTYIQDYINEKKLYDKIFIMGYLEKNEYEMGIKLSDIIVNLRYPSMGESSGTLCESFKYGKAVLVSDLNQYKEFPDEVCWKVPVNKYEVDTLTALLKCLIEHEDVRTVLGKNAQAYANTVLLPERIALIYKKVIDEE